MPSQPKQATVATHVAIVSRNPETTDDLLRYFRQVGVPSRATYSTTDLSGVPENATAAVIFPDDFETTTMVALIRALRKSRPHLLSLIITREPHHFRSLLRADGHSPSPVVLPRPSFGWDILDAIRAHARGGD